MATGGVHGGGQVDFDQGTASSVQPASVVRGRSFSTVKTEDSAHASSIALAVIKKEPEPTNGKLPQRGQISPDAEPHSDAKTDQFVSSHLPQGLKTEPEATTAPNSPIASKEPSKNGKIDLEDSAATEKPSDSIAAQVEDAISFANLDALLEAASPEADVKEPAIDSVQAQVRDAISFAHLDSLLESAEPDASIYLQSLMQPDSVASSRLDSISDHVKADIKCEQKMVDGTHLTAAAVGDRLPVDAKKFAEDPYLVTCELPTSDGKKATITFSPQNDAAVCDQAYIHDPMVQKAFIAFANEHNAKHNLPPQKAIAFIGLSATSLAKFQNDLKVALANLATKPQERASEKHEKEIKHEHRRPHSLASNAPRGEKQVDEDRGPSEMRSSGQDNVAKSDRKQEDLKADQRAYDRERAREEKKVAIEKRDTQLRVNELETEKKREDIKKESNT